MEFFRMCRTSACSMIRCDYDACDGAADCQRGMISTFAKIDLRECDDQWHGEYELQPLLEESVELANATSPRGLCPDISSKSNRKCSKNAQVRYAMPDLASIGIPLSMVTRKRVRYSKQVASRRKPREPAASPACGLQSKDIGRKNAAESPSWSTSPFENALVAQRDTHVDPALALSHECSKVPHLLNPTHDLARQYDAKAESPMGIPHSADGEQMARGIRSCIDALKKTMERSELHLMRANGHLVPATLVLSDDCSSLTLLYDCDADGILKQEQATAKQDSPTHSNNVVFRWNRDAQALFRIGDEDHLDGLSGEVLHDIPLDCNDNPLSRDQPDDDRHGRLGAVNAGVACGKHESGVVHCDFNDARKDPNGSESARNSATRRSRNVAMRQVNHVFVGRQEVAWKEEDAPVMSNSVDQNCVTLALARGECVEYITFSFPTLAARDQFARCMRIIRASIE